MPSLQRLAGEENTIHLSASQSIPYGNEPIAESSFYFMVWRFDLQAAAIATVTKGIAAAGGPERKPAVPENPAQQALDPDHARRLTFLGFRVRIFGHFPRSLASTAFLQGSSSHAGKSRHMSTPVANRALLGSTLPRRHDPCRLPFR